MFTEEQLKNISKNIEILASVYKEKHRDIAEAIGVGESTISGYVKGNPPKRENLSKIAKHFNMTEHQLINADLSWMLDINDENDFYSFLIMFLKNISIIFPVIKTKEHANDIDFHDAVKLNEEFWNNFEKGKIPDSNIDKILELYFLSYEKHKNLDSYANIAMILLILRINKKEDLSDYLDIYNPFDKIDLEFIVKDCFLTRFDDINDETLLENSEDNILKFIDVIIDELSNNDEYKDFVYYFITLRYIFGVGVMTKEKTADICNLIGVEMLNNLIIAKNVYAIQAIEKLEKGLNFK